MRKYNVSIELSGKQVPVGLLQQEDDSDTAVFKYLDSYRELSHVCPVSISLPLQKEAFPAEQTRCFFDGLLPEGFTRRSVAQWMHASENDYMKLLYGLGRECLGALRISAPEDIPEASYEKLDIEEVRKLAAEGAEKSAEIMVESHLSLTGASGKVGLYYDRKSDSWYLPRGSAPSTHIVKQSHVRLSGIVVNEQLALKTAERCGLEVPSCFIVNVGNGADADILLASERYDRILSPDSNIIGELPAPFRLHQEDFAQALGITSGEKYEKNGRRHMASMFQLLREYSQDPISDQQKLWDIIVFHWLIGNTDGHIKNFSLLYSPDMRSIHLAPAYDIVSTAIYPSCTREMAFSIGGDTDLDRIDRNSFRRAAHEVGISEKMALSRFDRLGNTFADALEKSAEELADAGFAGCEDIKKKILQNGGCRQLL